MRTQIHLALSGLLLCVGIGAAESPVTATASVSLEINGPATLQRGQRGRYTITLREPTGTPVGPITVWAILPANLAPLAANPQAVREQQSVRWQLDLANPSTPRQLAFEAQAQSSGPAIVEVSATVAITTQARWQTSIGDAQLDIAIDGPRRVGLGETFQATVRLTNSGATPVDNGGLALQLSDGLRLKDTPESAQTPFSLTPGQTHTVPLTIDGLEAGDQGIQVRAEADGGISRQAEHVLWVGPPPIEVRLAGPTSAIVGQNVELVLEVNHRGSDPASNVVAFVELPQSSVPLAAQPLGRFDAQQNMVYWLLGDLPPGATSRLRLSLRHDAPGSARIRGSIRDAAGIESDGTLETTIQSTPQSALQTAAP